ncbi:MAG TPA: M23 family metallopeptidase [Mycobacteriales bacterium]|nr:M23 family metallopeptidase [Mycobacteriales bacterium]
MSIGEVQARIGAIQAQMGVLAARTAAPAAPVATTTAAGTAAASGTEFAAALDSAVASGGTWAKPAEGRVTSGFGPRWGTQHKGLDIGATTGTPIRAVGEGTVRLARWYGGYGNAVIIDHANGVSTLYGHASELDVKPGQRVTAGQLIGKVGSTGDSTGPHLHLEVRVKDRQIDPQPWLTARGIHW